MWGSVDAMTDRLTDTGVPGVVLAELLGASKTFGTGAAAVHAVLVST